MYVEKSKWTDGSINECVEGELWCHPCPEQLTAQLRGWDTPKTVCKCRKQSLLINITLKVQFVESSALGRPVRMSLTDLQLWKVYLAGGSSCCVLKCITAEATLSAGCTQPETGRQGCSAGRSWETMDSCDCWLWPRTPNSLARFSLNSQGCFHPTSLPFVLHSE